MPNGAQSALPATGVTELEFRDSWLDRLSCIDDLTENGWYDPPPYGMAVLFASDSDPSRVSFESLRLPQFAPISEQISWDSGLMYAYCSPLHRPTGLAGDFGVTLYFGRRPEVRDHFRQAFAATAELLDLVTPLSRAADLLQRSVELFRSHGLQNTIASVSDATPLDLGHSIPYLEPRLLAGSRQLTTAVRDQLRGQRRFVSMSADWALAEEIQVTIEPQLIAIGEPHLPQVSFHYIFAASNGSSAILRDCDSLLLQFGLAD